MKVYSYTAGGAITEILKVLSGDVELVDCWDMKGASKNAVTASSESTAIHYFLYAVT